MLIRPTLKPSSHTQGRAIYFIRTRTDLAQLDLVLLMANTLGLLIYVLDVGGAALVHSMFHRSTAVRLVDSAEEDVHVLETAALGLLGENDDEDTHGNAEDTKHEESPPANVVDSFGGDFGDDETPEPLGCGCQADTV